MPLPPGDYARPLCGHCLTHPWRLARTVAAFAYAEPMSTLIAGFKYRAALQQGRVLGDLLIDRLRVAYHGQALPQLLVPVPLHPARLRERGFNQALVLARQLGRALHIPTATNLVARTQATPAQQGLNAKQRRRNLRGAFSMQPDDASLSAYASVALIDDVVTTMSTVNELVRMLHAHSKREIEIHVWCLARA